MYEYEERGWKEEKQGKGYPKDNKSFPSRGPKYPSKPSNGPKYPSGGREDFDYQTPNSSKQMSKQSPRKDEDRSYRQNNYPMPGSPSSFNQKRKQFPGQDEDREYRQDDYSRPSSPRQSKNKSFREKVFIHNPKTKAKGERRSQYSDESDSYSDRSPDFGSDNDTAYGDVGKPASSVSGRPNSGRRDRRDSHSPSGTKHAPREHTRRPPSLGKDYVFVSMKDIVETAAASVLRKGSKREVDRPDHSTGTYDYSPPEPQDYRGTRRGAGLDLPRQYSGAPPRGDGYRYDNERRTDRIPERPHDLRQRDLQHDGGRRDWGTGPRDYRDSQDVPQVYRDSQDLQHELEELRRREKQDMLFGDRARLAREYQRNIPTSGQYI
jgi:hypothetical protein